jgi:glycosyltransferase involved in cell wall biosynthesis
MLEDRYEVMVLVTSSNQHDTAPLAVEQRPVRAVRDFLPSGRLGNALAYAAGDRYLNLERHLRGADIVHAAELHTWFSAQAARLRRELGFRLVLTVWETLPSLDAYRLPRERQYRRSVMEAADLLLPATERAARALLLEGVGRHQIQVCPPGIDTERFSASNARAAGDEHVLLSPGRLVWEKGHHDALRAVAALQRGLLGDAPPIRLLIVGAGPEERRLRQHARELGIDNAVEFRRHIPYEEMPAQYLRSSAMVLASLPRRGWEEQFGMVLAEAVSSGTPICAARSGAISEVVGEDGALFEPGDWFGLARALMDGPLARAPAERVDHAPERIRRYSTQAAAERIHNAYDRLLAS